jgi:hypothetical protein
MATNVLLMTMRKMAPELGVVIEREVCNCHHKLYLRNKHGETEVVSVPVNPNSSQERNHMAGLKRFARKGEKR